MYHEEDALMVNPIPFPWTLMCVNGDESIVSFEF